MYNATTDPQKPAIASQITNQAYVIAIGASAGGLEAIHEFFDHMPINSNFIFVVIQHLSSDYKSLLVELVSKHTHMKVFEATNNMSMHPDCVYIIPNNKLMSLSANKLKLADKSHEKVPNTAIDTFLFSLAAERKEKAIAVILSGTGTDGTKGIEAIKGKGGMVIVQDPETAKFNGMPNSAIESGNADYVLAPAEMNKELYNYIHLEPFRFLENGKVNDSQLEEIFKMIHKNSSNDFNYYKTPTIIRRIIRRMTLLEIKSIEDYVVFLREHPEEVKVLGKDFLIGVTKFFRDKAAFELLESKIIPGIIDTKADGDTIKVWICACSTGEEAYSIAILLYHQLQHAKKNIDVKIFATDLDDSSIDIASNNCYPAATAKEVRPELLKKYFIKEGQNYSVIPAIRKLIVFAKHNVIKSPPFIKNDLITCRNMLIYMTGLLQQKILATFHFSLNPDGILFLGSSETVSAVKEGFVEINSKWRIYKKSGSLQYSHHNTYSTFSSGLKSSSRAGNSGNENNARKSIEDEFKTFLIEELGCAGIYIDKNYEIRETVGDFSKYLSLPEKKLNLNILKMVPHQLSLLLNNAIRKAWKDNKKTNFLLADDHKDGKHRVLNISIKPAIQGIDSGYTLVLFSEGRVDPAVVKEALVLPPITNDQQGEYILEMEAELNEVRANLQLTVEEMETTNEELQSSNEELLSANEELQSSNEELQSLNEELHTLNTEHQLKIRELIELNEDLDNYFASTDIGQLFIDSNLRIRKFNPAAIKMVNLIETDIGRPISHLSNNIRYEKLDQDIHQVLAHGSFVEKEVQAATGTSYLMRIQPYIKKDKSRDGVVISFVDISMITELNNIISGIFNTSNGAILAFRAVRDKYNHINDFKYLAGNPAAVDLLQLPAEALTPGTTSGNFSELFGGGFFDKFKKVIEQDTALKTETKFNDDWYQLNAVKMADGFVVNYSNITDRKKAEQKLKKNYHELIITREELKNLNNQLEGTVRERTQELSLSEDRFKLVSQATNDTIWDWKMAPNQMWRSENFEKMFGYQASDDNATINFWFDKIHPDDRERVEKSIFEAINQNKTHWSAEYRVMKADGDYAAIMDRGSILFNESGMPYRMVGSIVDISRLIDAEKRLTSSENKFKKIFDSDMIGMFFSDPDGHIVEANNSFLKMVGYDWDEIKNNNITWKNLVPQGFVRVNQEAFNKVYSDGYCPPFENQYLQKNGNTIPVLMGSALLEYESRMHTVSYIIDISVQKENEHRKNELQNLVKKQQEEFYSIFMNAPAIITIRRGPKLIYEFVNRAFMEFDGGTDYIGKTREEILGEVEDNNLTGIARRVMATGEPFIGKAWHIQYSDKSGIKKPDSWFDFIFNPVYNEDGVADGVAFFGFNVTDMVKAQQATKSLMEKKDEFMSIASHELKTPITTLKGALQIVQRMLSKKGDDTSIDPFIEKANKQVLRLTSLVEDLLNVTRIQEGKIFFNYSIFNADRMIKECVEEAQSNSPDHLIVFENNADVEIYADKPRLEQVISNFLMNAVKYSPDASEIQISTSVEDGFLKVCVTDFGIGIPGDKKDFIFDRFFRVQESATVFSGLGLGLYISSEIIRRHQGEIGVDSVVGTGSTFWFKIPVENVGQK